MPKINLPIDSTASVPNANNLVGEAMKYSSLEMTFPRTNTGQVSWTAYPSGITYNTADYASDANIYNRGEDGLLNLLLTLYGGENGWIVTADDFNASVVSVVNNLTTQTTGGALDAYQGYVLNTNKLDTTGTAANSLKFDGMSTSSFQMRNRIYTSLAVVPSAWTNSSTYQDYPFEATVSSITSAVGNVPLLSFRYDALALGILSPNAYLGANSITIYASEIPTVNVVISSLVVMV